MLTSPPLRLPTASTCFNLLKLPNYQKKATLKVAVTLHMYHQISF